MKCWKAHPAALSFLMVLFVSCAKNTQPNSLELVKEWGGLGSRPGQFNNPSSVAIGPDGSLYVTDSQNSRIQKFTNDGDFVKAWGEDLLESPVGITTDRNRFILTPPIILNK